ncbi:uncharacterized protein PRCAT00006167001 [Priceomyces carsonii]|uniref:uncharacterized protein n=1 Tax=Priceomyces carsonii TaxID=28549 RepID=UPI002EDAF52E|nr:unnamed protein product [Priceomyces carsonii]
MNSYISQFIPQLGGYSLSAEKQEDIEKVLEFPKIKRILIFNPDFADKKSESNEELEKQILCLVSSEKVLDITSEERINIIKMMGVIQGTMSFVKDFNENSLSEVTVIKTESTNILVKQVEETYHIACFLELVDDEYESNVIEVQFKELIDQAYSFFKLMNTSFEAMLKSYTLSILKDELIDFWDGFLVSYNQGTLRLKSNSVWPNCLNYKGFLGTIPGKPYKRSSLYLSRSAQIEMDQIIETHRNELHFPSGIIVSNFNKKEPKQYGMLYLNSNPSKNIDGTFITDKSLICIYNWLEFYDYHEKLDTNHLVKTDTLDLFASISSTEDISSHKSHRQDPDSIQEEHSTNNEEIDSQSFARSAFDMLNPITLTNNLVILPLNNSMNSVMTYGRTNNNANSTGEENSSWLPKFTLNPFGSSNENPAEARAAEENVETTNINNYDEIDDEDDDHGEFIIGPTKDGEQATEIQRKLIYLEAQENDSITEREYLLVLFRKDDIAIALVFDSSIASLDELQFYQDIQNSFFLPMIEQIENTLIGGSALGNSINSMKSMGPLLKNGLNNENRIEAPDDNFFFIVYDLKESWFKSSLPFLPFPSLAPQGISEQSISKYQNAICSLHGFLIDLFIIKSHNFFGQSRLDEYFHKFNCNRLNDWMIYYIEHKGRIIIIMRNQNHNTKNQRNKVSNSKKQGLTSSAASAIDHNGSGIFNHIVDGVYEQAQFGFLDNLGDDVKSWLETFSLSGET